MNTTSSSRSFLAEDIQAYLDFKRATGRKFHTEAAALRLLDRFLFGLPIDRTALSPTLIEAFLASRPRTRPRSFNHLLGVLRCFFAWLVAQGRLPHSPVQARPRPNSSRRLPFLFEPQQVQRLIELATQLLDNPRAMHRAEVYPLIFKLMYGLRYRSLFTVISSLHIHGAFRPGIHQLVSDHYRCAAYRGQLEVRTSGEQRFPGSALYQRNFDNLTTYLGRAHNYDYVPRNIIDDPPAAYPSEELEAAHVGIKDHLLGLARVGHHQKVPTVAQTQVRYLHLHRHPGHLHPLVAPVELKRLPGVEHQRDKNLSGQAAFPNAPIPYVPPNAVIAARVALGLQLLKEHDAAPTLTSGKLLVLCQGLL
jgi:hypothetical protein